MSMACVEVPSEESSHVVVPVGSLVEVGSLAVPPEDSRVEAGFLALALEGNLVRGSSQALVGVECGYLVDVLVGSLAVAG